MIFINAGIMCKLKVLVKAAIDELGLWIKPVITESCRIVLQFFLKTVREWEIRRSDESYSDMLELRNTILFVCKMCIFRVNRSPILKRNGMGMHTSAALIVPVVE